MTQTLYAGNLPWEAKDDDLIRAFAQYGTVKAARVITDRETGRSRGFGFVEMESGADEAVAQLNGAVWGGRTLVIRSAEPRPVRRARRSRGRGPDGSPAPAAPPRQQAQPHKER